MGFKYNWNARPGLRVAHENKDEFLTRPTRTRELREGIPTRVTRSSPLSLLGAAPCGLPCSILSTPNIRHSADPTSNAPPHTLPKPNSPFRPASRPGPPITHSREMAEDKPLEDWESQPPYKPASQRPDFVAEHRGSCHCGRVEYSLSRDRPLSSKYCHCRDCQVLHGKAACTSSSAKPSC